MRNSAAKFGRVVVAVWAVTLSLLVVIVAGQGQNNNKDKNSTGARGRAVLRKKNFRWFSTIAVVDGEASSVVCGGAVISSRHVVTTKRCVERATSGVSKELEIEVGYLCDRDDNCGRNKEKTFRISSNQVDLHPTLDLAVVALRKAGRRALPLLVQIAALVDTGGTDSLQKGDRGEMIGLERGDFNRPATADPDAAKTTLSLLRKYRIQYTSMNRCASSRGDQGAVDFNTCAMFKRPRNDCRVASMGSAVVRRSEEEGGRDVIVSLQSMLPPNPCVNPPEDTSSARRLPMGQVLLSEAFDFLRTVICVTEEESMTPLPEDQWCLSVPPEGGRRTSTGAPTPTPPAPPPADSLTSYSLQQTLVGHTAQVEPVVYDHTSAAATLLASGSYDGTIKLWNPNDNGGGSLFTQTPAHSNRVATLDFYTASIDGAERTRLVSGSEGKDIKVWNVVRNGGAVSLDPNPILLEGHSNQVRSVKWHSDGTKVISASYDFTIKVWNVAQEAPTASRLLRTLRGHSDWVNAVALHPFRTNQLVSVSDDETIRLWNIDTGLSLGVVAAAHDSWISSVDYSPDGRYLATGSIGNTVRIWRVMDLANGETTAPPFQLLDTLEGHDSWVYFVRWSPDGRYVASSSKDETIRIWGPSIPGDFASPWVTILTLEGHTDNVLSLDWSPDGMHLASGALDRTVRIWELIEGQPVDESSTAS